METDTKVQEYLTYDHMDSLRDAVRVYIESLGYQHMNGDGGGNTSADDDGLFGLEEFHNPTSGKRLFIELRIDEEDPEEPVAG